MRKNSSEWSSPALNSRTDATRSPKQGYQWPYKKCLGPPKIKEKAWSHQLLPDIRTAYQFEFGLWFHVFNRGYNHLWHVIIFLIRYFLSMNSPNLFCPKISFWNKLFSTITDLQKFSKLADVREYWIIFRIGHLWQLLSNFSVLLPCKAAHEHISVWLMTSYKNLQNLEFKDMFWIKSWNMLKNFEIN